MQAAGAILHRAFDSSGFLDSVRDDGGKLSIRFVEEPGQAPETLSLSASHDGRWRGELNGPSARQPVVMIRF